MTFQKICRGLLLAVVAPVLLAPLPSLAQASPWRYEETKGGDRSLLAATTADVAGSSVPVRLTLAAGKDHPREQAFGALSIVLSIDAPASLKGFHFDDFEGPDAVIRDRKLMHVRLVAAGKPTVVDLVPSGSYVEQGGREAFSFEASEPAARRRSPVRQILEMLGAGVDVLEVEITDSRDPRSSIKVRLPVAAERQQFAALLAGR
jgi:hypothetical protein